MTHKKTESDSKTDTQAIHINQRPDIRTQLLYWFIVIAGVTADLWTKQAVFQWLRNEPGREYSVIDGFFKFVIRENSGAAFSIASGHRTMLVTISCVAMIVVIGIFLFGKLHQRIMQVSLALFTAGIIGNLHDRIFNDGSVRDFIEVYYRNWAWPAFNIADSMLCVAVGFIILNNTTSLFGQKHDHPQK